MRTNVAIILSCVIFSASLRAEPMVSVARHSFCADISNLDPVTRLGDRATLRRGESLHLWLEIEINRAGLKYLRALGKLPVYVRWGRDGWLTDPPLDIGISHAAWDSNQDGITWKARGGGGVFRWRTYAKKASPINGIYYASILDANKKVITTIEFPAVPFRPEIAVKRDEGV